MFNHCVQLIKQNNLQEFMGILDQDPSMALYHTEDGKTLLWVSIQQQNLPLVEKLISIHSQVNFVRKSDQSTPLTCAISTLNVQLVTYLVENGKASLQETNKIPLTQESVLSYLIRKRNVPMLTYLLDKFCDTLKKDEDQRGRKGLHFAVASKDIWFVQLLVSKGFDLNEESKQGMKPIYEAIVSNCPDIVSYLLSCDNSLVNASSFKGETILHTSCIYGYLDIINLLVNSGASLIAVDENLQTPLHKAARSGYEAILDFLIEKMKSVEQKDKEGHTFLEVLAQKKFVYLVAKYVQTIPWNLMDHFWSKDSNCILQALKTGKVPEPTINDISQFPWIKEILK